jgi:glycosyltransferase involved in cell wall biosynthesis
MRISIVIATYGEPVWEEMAERRALPSALNQRRLADEIVIRHYRDASIAQARNSAAVDSNEEWLLFLDADDELDPRYVGAMRDEIAQVNREDIQLRQRYLLTPAVSYVRRGKRQRPRFLERAGLTLRDDNYLVVGTLIQRDLFFKVGGFGDYPHGFEDWSLWAKAWKEGAAVRRVPRAIYYAHVNPASAHRVAWKDRDWQVQMHHKVRKELFPEAYA